MGEQTVCDGPCPAPSHTHTHERHVQSAAASRVMAACAGACAWLFISAERVFLQGPGPLVQSGCNNGLRISTLITATMLSMHPRCLHLRMVTHRCKHIPELEQITSFGHDRALDLTLDHAEPMDSGGAFRKVQRSMAHCPGGTGVRTAETTWFGLFF